MKKYELIDNRHVLPTPAGVYYATASNQTELTRSLLLTLISKPESEQLTIDKLCTLSQSSDSDVALELLDRMQRLSWLASYEHPQLAPAGSLETILPPLLTALCSTGKVLLADQQGFTLASCGFTHEAAEELSALSADLASLRLRHSDLLFSNLAIRTHAFGLVDAAGNSQLGFWPLYIGKSQFTLCMRGIPRFNQPEFTQLAWALTNRYAANDFVPAESEDNVITNINSAIKSA